MIYYRGGGQQYMGALTRVLPKGSRPSKLKGQGWLDLIVTLAAP